MQMNFFPVRPMRPDDASSVAALVQTAFAAQPVPLDPPASALGLTAEGVVAHLAHAGGAVAEIEDRLVGSILWEPREDGLHVSRVAVDPVFRRRGIARALMAGAEQEARRRGLSRLVLGTRLALAGNRRLFAACGFAEIAEHAHPGYAAPTWVEMERRLQNPDPDRA
jgi:GNAT superfamily N-acetyltransferase